MKFDGKESGNVVDKYIDTITVNILCKTIGIRKYFCASCPWQSYEEALCLPLLSNVYEDNVHLLHVNRQLQSNVEPC